MVEGQESQQAGVLSGVDGDIPVDVAVRAFAGTSHVPEQRGEASRGEYAATLRGDYEYLVALAGTPEKQAVLDEEFTRYRTGYRERYLVMLAAKARCVSTMVAGPANFPVGQQRGRGDVADERTREVIEYRERALAAIRKALQPELRPIMSGDADAGERLLEKIRACEARQDLMRASNAAIRKHAKAGVDAQVAALVALGHAEPTARGLLVPDYVGRIGYPAFELTNNNANIHRLKGRLTVVERLKSAPTIAEEGVNARLEDVPQENRVRLFFPGKPEEAVRSTLKASGFRWTPTLGCWQAYRNDRALATATRVAGVAPEEPRPVVPVSHGENHVEAAKAVVKDSV